MEPFNEVAPSEDNYSSEEELKEIINEQKLKDGATSRSLKKKQQSASTPLEKRIQVKNNKNSTGSGNAAEKRKWSEVISDDETVEQQPGCEDDLETANSSQRSSRLYVQSAGGNTTASSSCSNEDESCVCGIRRLTTPVQFCTSPPMDVHRYNYLIIKNFFKFLLVYTFYLGIYTGSKNKVPTYLGQFCL